jgi:hypothetical protein
LRSGEYGGKKITLPFANSANSFVLLDIMEKYLWQKQWNYGHLYGKIGRK